MRVWLDTSILPKWLDPARAEPKSAKPKNFARTVGYRRQLFLSQPKWLTAADRLRYKAVYAERDRRRALGEDVHVDHIVPLLHPLVCGLNYHLNLAVIGAKENMAKGNNYWPGHPNENEELFALRPEPFQLRPL